MKQRRSIYGFVGALVAAPRIIDLDDGGCRQRRTLKQIRESSTDLIKEKWM